jgi:hypothetical protein
LIHQVEFIDFKQLTDGQVAVLAQCCGENSTLSWHTMASTVAANDGAREASINEHVKHVANLHESTQQALAAA